MRIAYLCADFGIPIRGYKGASVHVREMVAALAAEGHDVRVFAPTPGDGNALAVPLVRLGPEGLPELCAWLARRLPRRHPRLANEARDLAYNITFYRDLRRAWARWRPDVVYERYSLSTVAGLALARRVGAPHLLEVNAPLRLERARTTGIALDGVAGLIERRLFSGSDTLLTVSEALRRYALTRGARPARTLVAPNGVDTERFRPDVGGAAARRDLNLPADALVIGFAGSLKPWHGTDTLLDAFARARASAPRARLLIIGDGPQSASLRAHATALGMDDAVRFTGKVAHAAMPGLLAAMTVGVAPYLDVPDFYFSPLKLYEYMAAGLPVVASDAGEIGTLVRDGRTGLLCPPGDPTRLAATLVRLLGDPDLRARLGVAARGEAERHTWRENARRVTTLAGSLATARHPGRRTTCGERGRP